MRDDLQSELIRRLAEPDPLRTLRRQKERIEADRRAEWSRVSAEREADRLRREIAAMGFTPEA